MHITGTLAQVETYGVPAHFSVDRIPGYGRAIMQALAMSRGEWIVYVSDDMVFLPGWNHMFADRARPWRFLCFDLLEPIWGSFPPPVDAGTSPATFRPAVAADAARARMRAEATPGDFFGTFVFHRSLIDRLTPGGFRWTDEEDWRFAFTDVDFPWRVHLRLPDVVFGRLGTCVYHFCHASWHRSPHKDHDPGIPFRGRYGVTIGTAYDVMNAHSISRWR